MSTVALKTFAAPLTELERDGSELSVNRPAEVWLDGRKLLPVSDHDKTRLLVIGSAHERAGVFGAHHRRLVDHPQLVC